jgi:subtilisin family serine protease
VVVVVAAGNEHDRAEALRQNGAADAFDTELACPGHARSALTVAAMTKQTFVPASFSSRGPAAYGAAKPDLAAPGVNITSLAPVPRGLDGRPVAAPPRVALFARDSGTSMATPMVAGAAALAVQERMLQGKPWTPSDIRDDILRLGLAVCPDLPTATIGGGRLALLTGRARARAVLAQLTGATQTTAPTAPTEPMAPALPTGPTQPTDSTQPI